MLREATSNRDGDEATDWAWSASNEHGEHAWQRVDRELRGIARRRAALDAKEAQWLREAERLQVWRPLGMVSMLDYLERVLGYAPRTGQDRLRVARALEQLPVVTDALATGALSFSAVRELARVATPATEATWCAHVSGMNLRQIEEAVAGHRPGDLPSDPPDPEAREHVLALRLTAEAYALWRQARLQLDEEHDHRLDDSEVIMALASPPRSDASGESSGRAKFQIALTLCPHCERATQLGAGVNVPVDASVVERARCDAQYLGSLDGDGPERAHQEPPPSVVRFIHRRDDERCQTPGCRSARGVEIHHIVHRDGGTHEPSNLTLRCFSCHAAHHRGLLEISGEAPDRIVTTRRNQPTHSPSAHADPAAEPARPRSEPKATAKVSEASASGPSQSRFDQVALRTQARDALVGLGWKPGIARCAVDEARAHVGPTATLEVLILEALRRCPKPRA